MAIRLSLLLLVGCAGGVQQIPTTASSPAPSDTSSSSPTPDPPTPDPPTPDPPTPDPPSPDPSAAVADVVEVSASGGPGAYTFAVSIRSDETGCDRYADWWEVLSEDGTLLFRRILDHSHPTEQPFTRTGGPVALAADEPAWVRAHLSPGGFVGQAMFGTVASGFEVSDPGAGFAPGVETQPPQPDGCAF